VNAKQRLLEARAVMQSDPERAAELLRLVTLESEDEEHAAPAAPRRPRLPPETTPVRPGTAAGLGRSDRGRPPGQGSRAG
jgi:hypothetical protein